MADDWDVEDLLEAPFKKGTEKVSFGRNLGDRWGRVSIAIVL